MSTFRRLIDIDVEDAALLVRGVVLFSIGSATVVAAAAVFGLAWRVLQAVAGG